LKGGLAGMVSLSFFMSKINIVTYKRKNRMANRPHKDESNDVIDRSKEKVKTSAKPDLKYSRKLDLNLSFHISQDKLKEIEILCPLSIKQEKYLNNDTDDIVVWGGAAAAGKTQLSLLRIMVAGLYDKNYVAGIARKSQRQMKQAGSLWSSGCKLFAKHGVTSNKVDLTWSFPTGAEVKCHHLDNNQDDWQGTQCTEFLVDEAQQCNEEDVWYLTSRLRSQSKRKHQLRLTCNPLNTSFLCKWLEKGGYILENGLPNPDMDGVSSFMLELNGEFHFYKTRKEIETLYGKEIASYSSSFIFYAANVYDNPYIRRYQPSYVHKLENLKPLEKQRLLLGNWYAKLDSEGFIKREWFNQCNFSDVPMDLPTIRCYDLASSPVSPAYKDPDWTRGVKATYDKVSGNFYITGMVSLRDRPAKVQQLIENTAHEDGKHVYIGLPIDAGQSGKEAAENKRSRLVMRGYRPVMCLTRKSKLQRAEPFLMALQQGKVFVQPNVLSDSDYDELENFTGQRNPFHDDIIDAISDCWTQLVAGSLIPSIKMDTSTPRMRNIGGRTLL
jgi:predicted phage terminase large subunit-like protein